MNIKRQREEQIKQKLTDMGNMGIDATSSPPDFEASPLVDTEPPPKVEKDTSEPVVATDTPTHSEDDLSARYAVYQEEFLHSRPILHRVNCGISSSTMQILRNVVKDLEEDVPVSVFVDNILVAHLRMYCDLINSVASERRRSITIPK